MLVVGVLVGSAADAAGIRRDDVILNIKGNEMHDLTPLLKLAAENQPGHPLPVEILRDGRHQFASLMVDQLRN